MSEMRDCDVEIMMNGLMSALRFENCKVTQYPYRKARIIHTLVKVPRNDKIEKLLLKKAGKQQDNHTMYKITYEDGMSVVVMCSDSTMRLGIGVMEKSW